MTKVVLDISMSLDGFIAQPDDAAGPIHEWFFAGDEPHARYPRLTPNHGPSGAVLDATHEATGGVIAGRRTYASPGDGAVSTRWAPPCSWSRTKPPPTCRRG